MIDIEGINIWNQLCPPERKEEGFLLMWNILSKEAIVGRWLENYTFIQNQKRLIQIQQKQLQFFTSLFQNLIKALRFPFDFLSGVYSFVVQKIYKFPNFINKES